MTNRSDTIADITKILNNNTTEPESLMLSSKRSLSGSFRGKTSNSFHSNIQLDGSDDDNHPDHDDDIPYVQYNNDTNVNTKYATQNQQQQQYGSPASFNTHDQLIIKHEKCMRRILQLTFIICIIFFISPLIFFIFGASEIIPEYARISEAVRMDGDTDDTSIKALKDYPTMKQICNANGHDCIRYTFFLLYLIIFTIMFVCCISLFAIRKQQHPLKSRSCKFISIFCLSLPFYIIWACVGLMYSPGWLGCYTSHTFNNLAYPLLIFPYFFRAYRIKKIYDEATINYDKYNDGIHIFRSARTQSIISINNYNENATQTHSNSKGNIQRKMSNSINSEHQSSLKLDSAINVSHKLDRKLLKIFILFLIPFVLVSIMNYLPFIHFHLLPTFIKSCDPSYLSTSILIWGIIHLIEIFFLILIVYWIRLVWRAFSVKQELMIVAVIDMVFCACMIGFSPTQDTIDDGIMVLYLILMRGIGFFMITILLPLYRTYFSSYLNILPDIPTQDVITSLSAILDDMDACVFFRRFMNEQDSQYLLDFWMEIDLFKDACLHNEILPGNNMRYSASKIFKKYFSSNNNSKQAKSIRYIINLREKEVNKSYNKNQNFLKAISKIFDENNKNSLKIEIHSNIFDYPHRVIFEHMENIHYRLFLRSQYCKQLLSSVAGQEEIFRKLINQEML